MVQKYNQVTLISEKRTNLNLEFNWCNPNFVRKKKSICEKYAPKYTYIKK